MSDWIVGISTVAVIFGGAAAYAAFVIKFAAWEKPEARGQREIAKPDFRAAAKKQAEAASLRQYREKDVMSIWAWVEIAVRHLITLWPTMSYEQARFEMKDYLEEAIAAWPSRDWDYSASSAREMAEEYAREYGESYGANQ